MHDAKLENEAGIIKMNKQKQEARDQ